MQLSSQQLAELLIGIARAQIAMAQGLKAPDQPVRTLADLPLSILVNAASSTGADAATVAKELERLCAGRTPSGGPGPDLDFGAPPP